MIISRTLILTQRIRFLRWSRNVAAIFHSYLHEISIGKLKANVQERIAGKKLTKSVLHFECTDPLCELFFCNEIQEPPINIEGHISSINKFFLVVPLEDSFKQHI